MVANLVPIKVKFIDKIILQKFIKTDYLEKNPNVSDATINELFNFLLTEYLGHNYNILKSKLKNDILSHPKGWSI